MSVRLVTTAQQRSSLLLRSFFTLPDPLSISLFPGSNNPQKYHEQKVLPYKPSQLYAIVADVAHYPRFVPFCTGSRILHVSERSLHQGVSQKLTDMEAELTVGFFAIKESYVSRVTCRPFESVQAVASSSTPLFKTLETKWHFRPVSLAQSSPGQLPQIPNPESRNSTIVTLDLTFAFANPLYAKVSAAFFTQASTLMVKAFEDECLRVYGPPSA